LNQASVKYLGKFLVNCIRERKKYDPQQAFTLEVMLEEFLEMNTQLEWLKDYGIYEMSRIEEGFMMSEVEVYALGCRYCGAKTEYQQKRFSDALSLKHVGGCPSSENFTWWKE